MFYKVWIFFLLMVGARGAMPEDKRKQLNNDIGYFLNNFDDVYIPNFNMDGDLRPYATALITYKWLQYLQPEPNYFGNNVNKGAGTYNYETFSEQLKKSIQRGLTSKNPRRVDPYSNTIITFANGLDWLKRSMGNLELLEAVQEMILQSYIELTQQPVSPGDTLNIKGDLFLRLKNPQLDGAELEKAITRTFTVPALDTLTVLKKYGN